MLFFFNKYFSLELIYRCLLPVSEDYISFTFSICQAPEDDADYFNNDNPEITENMRLEMEYNADRAW